MTVDWTAIWTAVNAIATMVLVGLGYSQIRSLRHESKVERTLAACSRYEADPVIERSVRSLREHKEEFVGGTRKPFTHDVVMVLNWLDTIAIGIDQGLYDERLARDHIAPILNYYVANYADRAVLNSLEINQDDYRHLCQLAQRWSTKKPHFTERG